MRGARCFLGLLILILLVGTIACFIVDIMWIVQAMDEATFDMTFECPAGFTCPDTDV